MAYDLKITGGTIIDGTGKQRYRAMSASAAARSWRSAARPRKRAETIDAAGRVVAPGFVDIHTHYDAQILWDRMLTISPWHGVTTVVMGNCGFGVAPTRRAHREPHRAHAGEGRGHERRRRSQAGLGDEWGFETFPQYLDAIERARHRDQCRRAHRPHAAASLCDGRGGDRARGDAPRKSCAMRALVLRSARRRRARLRHLEVADPCRLSAAGRCRAAPPISPRSARSPARSARPATACCRRPPAPACCSTSSRRSRARPAPM